MHIIFEGFGILHTSTEVASTLFYHLSSLSFTSSPFAPSYLFDFASTSSPDSARTRCHHSLSHIFSAGFCVLVPPYSGCYRCTITTEPYRHLPQLPYQSELLETVKNSAAFGGRSGSPLPSSSEASYCVSFSSAASSVIH